MFPSREEIGGVALTLLDEQVIKGVSFRRLAAALLMDGLKAPRAAQSGGSTARAC